MKGTASVHCQQDHTTVALTPPNRMVTALVTAATIAPSIPLRPLVGAVAGAGVAGQDATHSHSRLCGVQPLH